MSVRVKQARTPRYEREVVNTSLANEPPASAKTHEWVGAYEALHGNMQN